MKTFFLLFLAATGLMAQTGTIAVPDCVLQFSFLESGGSTQTSQVYTNYPASGGTGGGECTTWVVTYATSGVSTSISVLLQSANVASGQLTPGSFTTYAGTTVTGVNPTTTTTGGQFFGTNDAVSTPFLRVQVSSFMDAGGRVWGTLLGYKSGPSGGGGSGGGGCPGTTGTPCVVVGPTAAGAAPATDPVMVAGQDGTNVQTIKTDTGGQVIPANASSANADGVSNTTSTQTGAAAAVLYPRVQRYDFNGSTWDRSYSCPNSAPITFSSASGSLQVVGLTSSQIIRICSISLSSDTVTNITLQYGTGSNCGTGTTALSGAYQNVLSMSVTFGPESALRTIASNAFCVNSSASSTIGGLVTYAKF